LWPTTTSLIPLPTNRNHIPQLYQEEGIPIYLGDFEEVPGIMAKPPKPTDNDNKPPTPPAAASLAPRANAYGIVFPEAFQQDSSASSDRAFIRSFKQTRTGRDADLPTIAAGEWWRMAPEAQQAWLLKKETTRVEQGDSGAGGGSDVAATTTSTGTVAVARSAARGEAAAVVFKLRGRLLGAARVQYDKATGRFALAETPLLERNRLFTSSGSTKGKKRPLLPALIRYPCKLARPLYAPLFSLRWLSLRLMVLWRALRQFVLPSWPYLLLFTARAAYLLSACMLLTVLVDELLQPLAQALYQALLWATAAMGKDGAALTEAAAAAGLPDFRGYSLKSGDQQEMARTWVERWSEPLVAGVAGGGVAGGGGGGGGGGGV
jgi:hypothetical protein